MHRHKWIETHYNGYYLSTREKCNCGLFREIQHKGEFPYSNPFWVYSDGNEEPDERVFKHVYKKSGVNYGR